MGLIDKKKVMRSFGRQAGEYDGGSGIQKRIVMRLLEQLRTEAVTPVRLLDIGAGTGNLLHRLQGIYPGSCRVGIDIAPEMGRKAREKAGREENLHFIAADAELLPFADRFFDVVLSTSTLQWLNSLDISFAEAFRVLAPGGVFCFALFGEGTLHELKDSYRLALDASGRGNIDRSHLFFSVKEVEKALVKAGFDSPLSHREIFLEMHDDVPALLRSLKKIGAGNASPLPPQGLGGRRVMHELFEIYRDNYGIDTVIPATYEVIFALATKPDLI